MTEFTLDEEMEDGAEKPAQQSQDTNPATPAINTLQEVPESLVSISKGRRRGRRRVMRKKTIKDEEGFLGMYSLTRALTRLGSMLLTTGSDKI